MKINMLRDDYKLLDEHAPNTAKIVGVSPNSRSHLVEIEESDLRDFLIGLAEGGVDGRGIANRRRGWFGE